jgi:hypothetical protein
VIKVLIGIGLIYLVMMLLLAGLTCLPGNGCVHKAGSRQLEHLTQEKFNSLVAPGVTTKAQIADAFGQRPPHNYVRSEWGFEYTAIRPALGAQLLSPIFWVLGGRYEGTKKSVVCSFDKHEIVTSCTFTESPYWRIFGWRPS